MSVTNQLSYCNVKSFKKWKFWEFWAIDRTWPTLDKIYYLYSYKWKINKLDAYIKIGKKEIHLTSKKGKFKTSHRKSEEKGEFESLGSESLCFKGGTPIMLRPSIVKKFKFFSRSKSSFSFATKFKYFSSFKSIVGSIHD